MQFYSYIVILLVIIDPHLKVPASNWTQDYKCLNRITPACHIFPALLWSHQLPLRSHYLPLRIMMQWWETGINYSSFICFVNYCFSVKNHTRHYFYIYVFFFSKLSGHMLSMCYLQFISSNIRYMLSTICLPCTIAKIVLFIFETDFGHRWCYLVTIIISLTYTHYPTLLSKWVIFIWV